MRLNSKDNISGFPILTVRKFLRNSGFSTDINSIKYFFKTESDKKPKSFLKALIENELVAFEKESEGKNYYTITDKGSTLSKATARKPIFRSTADRLISKFINRLKTVRDKDYYLFKVKKATIFGSYLSDTDRLSDIDIAIEIIPKEKNHDKHMKLVEKRLEDVQLKGRKFKTYLEAIFWPQTEVEQFLRAGSPSISLEIVDQDKLEKLDHKIIYSDM